MVDFYQDLLIAFSYRSSLTYCFRAAAAAVAVADAVGVRAATVAATIVAVVVPGSYRHLFLC